MDLLQYAGYGTDVIGAIFAGWYTSSKMIERNLKRDERIEAMITRPRSVAARLPEPNLALDLFDSPISGSANEADPKQQPESAALRLIRLQTNPYQAVRPALPAWTPSMTGPADEEETEPEAEKLLVTTMPFLGRFFDFGIESVESLWGQLSRLGWLRLAVAVPFALVLFCVGSALIGVALPFAIVVFLLDGDKDFRLRLVVLAFAAGLCIEIVSHLPG